MYDRPCREVPGCTGTAVSDRGRYANVCGEHKHLVTERLRASGAKLGNERSKDTVTPLSQQRPEPAKPKVYLAGPMRGIELYNFPAFETAAADLRERGFDVWSPAEHDVHADGFDPETDEAKPMLHYMRRDLPAVMYADRVVVLPGWQKSTGARLEVHVADACGIPVVRYPDLQPARHPTSTAYHRKLEQLAVTHDVKSADYGTDGDPLANVRASERLGIPAWVGVELRVGDKAQRIASFVQKGALANESLEDSILDRAVYSVIQLVLLDEAADG